jgi:ABC-type lipoprotein export system ATPase subunit
MVNSEDVLDIKIEDLLDRYPFLDSYFKDNELEVLKQSSKTLSEFFSAFDETQREDMAFDEKQTVINLVEYINQMVDFLGMDNDDRVNSLTISAGTDKDGNSEKFGELSIKKSEVICIVGPTGSGKSRLLADIEWTAQRDTPTKRCIKINGEKPDMKWRFSSSNKLVAQLSQNMNFVMDLSVIEFLRLHAKSRLIEDEEELIEKIIIAANDLAGESFDPDTPITSLSGGQSRALMIADTAILSRSPIILIDEIENAGIDRKKALKFLVGEEKIVLMATHDPILALMGDKRIVIKNGGIEKIINTSDEEREILVELEKMDGVIQSLRVKLRSGENLT